MRKIKEKSIFNKPWEFHGCPMLTIFSFHKNTFPRPKAIIHHDRLFLVAKKAGKIWEQNPKEDLLQNISLTRKTGTAAAQWQHQIYVLCWWNTPGCCVWSWASTDTPSQQRGLPGWTALRKELEKSIYWNKTRSTTQLPLLQFYSYKAFGIRCQLVILL